MPNTSYAQRISNRGVAIQDSGSLEGSNKRILNFSTDLAVDCTTPTAGCTVSSTAGGSTYDTIKVTGIDGQDVDNDNADPAVTLTWSSSFERPDAGTNSFALTNSSTTITYDHADDLSKIVCFDINILITSTNADDSRHEFLAWLNDTGSCGTSGSRATTTPDSHIGEMVSLYHRHRGGSVRNDTSYFASSGWRTCVLLADLDTTRVCVTETTPANASNTGDIKSAGTSLMATVMD